MKILAYPLASALLWCLLFSLVHVETGVIFGVIIWMASLFVSAAFGGDPNGSFASSADFAPLAKVTWLVVIFGLAFAAAKSAASKKDFFRASLFVISAANWLILPLWINAAVATLKALPSA